MADNYANDSYTNSIMRLRARYSDRGVSISAKKTVNAQRAKEEKRESVSPAKYVELHELGEVSSEYRSGEYAGRKYMTSQDYIRYFKNRHEYSMPLILQKTQNASAGRRTAASGRSSGKSSLIKSESTSKEGHLSTRIETFRSKWFPVEPKEGREVGTKFKFPAKAIGNMAAFALSLGLIISGSVMMGSARGEIGRLNGEISKLKTEQTELQSQLDLKYNIQDIEADAKALGMINNEYADKSYLEVADDEEIEIFEQEEEKVGFAALLSAIGINFD